MTTDASLISLPPPDDEPSDHYHLHPLRRLWVIIKHVILITIGSYGLSVSLHIVLRSMVDETSNFIAFFNTFAHLLWMPALVLLPVLLILRQWRIALMLILPVFMFVTTYGDFFMGRQINPPTETEQVITLQTHNLLARNRTPEQIPDIIETLSADIVALQEVSVAFEQRLLDIEAYPYTALHGMSNDGTLTQRETMGQGVLSKYPIIEDDYWTYDFLAIPLGHQRVVVDVDGQLIVIYNVHPTHPGMSGQGFFNIHMRRQEIKELLTRIQSETLPVIMIGDFNMTDLNYEYGQITQHLIDTHREVGTGMGFTFPDFQESNPLDSMEIFPDNFPAQLPIPLLMRLDYVFHSEEFRGISSYIHHTSGGSDHRPVLVMLTLEKH